MSSEHGNDRQHVTALARGLSILRCFSHVQPELALSEIVRKTALPQPTVWRLCHTLIKEGFLDHCTNGTHLKLGLPVLALGYAARSQHALSETAKPYMQALTDKYRLGTALAIRDGLDMLYIQRTHGDFIYLNDPVGARRSFTLAATGWACFAAYSVEKRQQLLTQLAISATPSEETYQALQNAADQYQGCGFITSIGVVHEHLNAVAVPICSLNSGAIYGLSASGLASDWPQEKLLEVGYELTELSRKLATVAT